MLTQLAAYSIGATANDIPLAGADDNPASDPIQIRNIEGLGPVATTINTTKYGSIDGEFYMGSSTGKRNIVLTLGFNPNWDDLTYESLRRMVYRYFLPETQVRLVFTSTHMPQVQISGYVETCEPNIFSKDPEMVVSIVCLKPYFVATRRASQGGLTTALTDNSVVTINNAGDTEVGFELKVSRSTVGLTNGEIQVINNTPNIQLFDVAKVSIDTTHYFRLSTVPGNKYAKRFSTSGGVPTNLIGGVVPGSFWMPLARGDNNFQIMSSTPGLAWSLTYNALYGGI